MVITDVPFDARIARKNSRYTLIRRPGSALAGSTSDDNDEDPVARESKEYASFLKETERRCGQDGFLDSKKYTHSYEVNSATPADGTPRRAGTPRPTSLPIKPTNAVNIVLRAEQDGKDYDKRIKVIEDHMWQHKQEERELKRVEGDVLKKRYAVRHTLRDYENKVRKNRLDVEKNFNKGMEKYTKLEQHHLHQKVETVKDRGEKNVDSLHQSKDQGRKVELQKTNLARKYRTKIDELELKQVEHNRMVSEFESKLKQKEQEQYKLKAELAELAITLNMEAQKGREMKVANVTDKRKETTQRIKQDLDTQDTLKKKLGKGDVNVKTSITQKRRLSADLTLTRAHMGLKNREEIRQLQDTRNELNDNTHMQRKLNETAVQAELDYKTKKIDNKLQMHEARKMNRMHAALTNRKEKSESQEKAFAEKFQRRFHDMAKREHEDHLKHFQKMVVKGEEEENKLYNHVREAEFSRQKQEQTVKRIQQSLLQTKSRNSQEMKSKLTMQIREEKEIEQQLSREKAQLDKLHAEREENYEKLQKHREMLKNDKHNLQEHDREHHRLQKIAARAGAPTEVYS